MAQFVGRPALGGPPPRKPQAPSGIARQRALQPASETVLAARAAFGADRRSRWRGPWSAAFPGENHPFNPTLVRGRNPSHPVGAGRQVPRFVGPPARGAGSASGYRPRAQHVPGRNWAHSGPRPRKLRQASPQARALPKPVVCPGVLFGHLTSLRGSSPLGLTWQCGHSVALPRPPRPSAGLGPGPTSGMAPTVRRPRPDCSASRTPDGFLQRRAPAQNAVMVRRALAAGTDSPPPPLSPQSKPPGGVPAAPSRSGFCRGPPLKLMADGS